MTMSKQITVKPLSDPLISIFVALLLIGGSGTMFIIAALTVSATVKLFGWI